MNNRMTVGADRAKVFDGIDLVCASDVGERAKVVNVNEPLGNLPIDVPEADLADATSRAVMFKAPTAGVRAAFVDVDRDAPDFPLRDGRRRRDLLGQQQGCSVDPAERFQGLGDLGTHFPPETVVGLMANGPSGPPPVTAIGADIGLEANHVAERMAKPAIKRIHDGISTWDVGQLREERRPDGTTGGVVLLDEEPTLLIAHPIADRIEATYVLVDGGDARQIMNSCRHLLRKPLKSR
ncbi:hypothetical protein [Tautonia sociabilis]|uniref:Uncharacterized protein n=1 Tax=Tautonia sociabilis TaxID=2080755 RepID=A0A432MDE3_9BACT|nr:hypothetical protein [Tautonia sociabilis]RUL82216.1 hypothetical protein TsocGM_23815 [Tautonia sociabilis]